MSAETFDATLEALREQLCERMRRTRPRLVFCIIGGEKRKMDTGGGRGVRYSQLARVIVAMGTTLERVDLCNAKGELIESWHPRGAIVEDEPDDAEAPATFKVPPGLASLPAELVGEVLTLALAFARETQRDTQRAIDHAVDRHLAGSRQLVGSLVDVLRTQVQRAERAEEASERAKDRAAKREERAAQLAIEAREVALDAKRLAEEGDDPNSPDAIAADFARRTLERQFGLLPAGAPAAAGAAGAQSRALTTKKDRDEN